jgi:hypothetical protein
MIDTREYRHAFGCHFGREPVGGCLGAVRAWQRYQAVFGHCWRSDLSMSSWY